MANCPKCDCLLLEVRAEPMPITLKPDTLVGLALTCPECHTLLSVAVDPIALQNRILKELADEMERRQQAVAATLSPAPTPQPANGKPKRRR
jgi:hypothetical protein